MLLTPLVPALLINVVAVGGYCVDVVVGRRSVKLAPGAEVTSGALFWNGKARALDLSANVSNVTTNDKMKVEVISGDTESIL